MVNFITLHRHTRQRLPGPGQRAKNGLPVLYGFGLFKHGDQRQQPQPRPVAVDAMEVDQRLTQHLQAATDPQHRPTPPGVGGNGGVQPLCAQPGQVAAGVFGAGQDDPVCRYQIRSCPRPLHLHTGHIL